MSKEREKVALASLEEEEQTGCAEKMDGLKEKPGGCCCCQPAGQPCARDEAALLQALQLMPV